MKHTNRPAIPNAISQALTSNFITPIMNIIVNTSPNIPEMIGSQNQCDHPLRVEILLIDDEEYEPLPWKMKGPLTCF